MSNSITVDIVTITRQIDNILFNTLNNVSQQTYELINHVIIYRPSTQTDIKQLENFTHTKNLLFFPQVGVGIASAFNNGINHTQGDLVLFLNAGDTLVAKDAVEKVVASYLEEKWLWATGETIAVSKNRYLKNYRPQHQNWTDDLFWYGNPVCHQSTFYSRSLIKLLGLYNESLSMNMDYEYNIRANLLSPPKLLYFPIAYYDTTGVSSIRVFQQFNTQREIRDRYFKLSKFNQLRVDTYGLFKSILRLAMLPAKLWL